MASGDSFSLFCQTRGTAPASECVNKTDPTDGKRHKASVVLRRRHFSGTSVSGMAERTLWLSVVFTFSSVLRCSDITTYVIDNNSLGPGFSQAAFSPHTPVLFRHGLAPGHRKHALSQFKGELTGTTGENIHSGIWPHGTHCCRTLPGT